MCPELSSICGCDPERFCFHPEALGAGKQPALRAQGGAGRQTVTVTRAEKGPAATARGQSVPFHLHFYPFTCLSVDNSNI